MKVTVLLTILMLSLNAYSYQFSDNEIKSILRDVTNDYSKNLPITVDAGTILEGVIAGEERNIIYQYKLTFISPNDPSFDIFVDRIL